MAMSHTSTPATRSRAWRSWRRRNARSTGRVVADRIERAIERPDATRSRWAIRPTCRCTIGRRPSPPRRRRRRRTRPRRRRGTPPEMIGMAMLPITCSGGSITPYGRLAATRSSGTNTSSRTMSLLAVPRIPRVSQLSRTVTPSLARGTAMLSTRRPCSGSSNPNIVDITVPWSTGWRTPCARHEVATFDLRGLAPRPVKSAPPVDTSTIPSSATRRRVASAPGRIAGSARP